MTNRVCPACGWHVHHSHTRGFREKFVRTLTSYKMYRCRECGWRGWIGKSDLIARKHRLRLAISLILTLLAALLLASLVIDRIS